MATEPVVQASAVVPPLSVVNVGAPAPAPIAVPPVGSAQEAQPAKIEEAPKTFTQEQLNAILKERLDKAESAATKRILEALGVDSLDAVKTAVTSAKTAEEANQTELQKLQKKIDAVTLAHTQAQARIDAFEQKEKIGIRNAAISKKLVEANATNAEDLLILLSVKNADLVDAALTAEGKADEKAIEALVAKAQAEYSGSFASKAPGSPSNARGKAPTNDEAKQRGAFATARQARSVFGS